MSHALIPVVVVLLGFGVSFLVNRNLTSRYDYECANCGTRFAIAPAAAAIAPHRMGRAKYVKCPNCGQRSWATAVPKE
jgi:predicted Zn finger-like uncharacterized protein